jgi:hypothetical protein
VIGGHTIGGTTFDALVFGYYEGSRLMYGRAEPQRLYAFAAGAANAEIPSGCRSLNVPLPIFRKIEAGDGGRG